MRRNLELKLPLPLKSAAALPGEMLVSNMQLHVHLQYFIFTLARIIRLVSGCICFMSLICFFLPDADVT